MVKRIVKVIKRAKQLKLKIKDIILLDIDFEKFDDEIYE